MKSKKILSIITAGVLTLSLASGCGKKVETKTPEKAVPTTTTQAATGKYTDGTYKATFDFIDGHGWKPQIQIIIKEKKISEVKFDYVNPAGELKSENAAYNKAMKAKAGTSPEEYVPKLNKNLLDTQDIEKIDTVTGATDSSNYFKELGKVTLEKASKGDTSETILAMNTTYKASTADFDERGWKGEVSLTYADGKMSKVEYMEVNKDGKKKSEDKAYEKMKATAGVSPTEAYTKLTEAALKEDKVVTVSGATGISTTFKTLYAQAKAMRK